MQKLLYLTPSTKSGPSAFFAGVEGWLSAVPPLHEDQRRLAEKKHT